MDAAALSRRDTTPAKRDTRLDAIFLGHGEWLNVSFSTRLDAAVLRQFRDDIRAELGIRVGFPTNRAAACLYRRARRPLPGFAGGPGEEPANAGLYSAHPWLAGVDRRGTT